MTNFNFLALWGLLLTTSMAASVLPPQASSDGMCYSYIIQGTDTCDRIAQANGITVAEIEQYNTNTYAWWGCNGEFYQGTFICLSPGNPPMPVALPQATCGPQVPGTTRPEKWSDLASLNPCPSDACVSPASGAFSLAT